MRPLSHGAREIREEGASIPDWYIRHVLGHPKSGEHAQANARYAAILVETDRETYRG
jgi:hypothetical protein